MIEGVGAVPVSEGRDEVVSDSGGMRVASLEWRWILFPCRGFVARRSEGRVGIVVACDSFLGRSERRGCGTVRPYGRDVHGVAESV